MEAEEEVRSQPGFCLPLALDCCSRLCSSLCCVATLDICSLPLSLLPFLSHSCFPLGLSISH